MSEQWAVLGLHGVEDIPSLVRKLLATLPGGNFQDHMTGRRIRKVEFKNILDPATMMETSDKQGFDMILSFGVDSSVEEWMISIGHELGHTFAYGIKLSSPLRLRWRLPYRIADPEEEEFCELFGTEWAALDGGHPALRTLLQEYLEKPRSEVLNAENRWRHTIFDFENIKN